MKMDGRLRAANDRVADGPKKERRPEELISDRLCDRFPKARRQNSCRSKHLLLRLGHVFCRARGDVLWLDPVYIKRILMQIQTKVEKLVGYLHGDHCRVLMQPFSHQTQEMAQVLLLREIDVSAAGEPYLLELGSIVTSIQ